IHRTCQGAPSMTPHHGEEQSYHPIADGRLVIGANSRSLGLAELPISVRLRRVLEKKGVARLGDLQGTSLYDLRWTKDCGRKTIEQLLTLLERAEAGEFSVSQEALERLSASDLPGLIDGLLAALPPRDREMTLLRFGSAGRVHNLNEAGEKFGVTRERVR